MTISFNANFQSSSEAILIALFKPYRGMRLITSLVILLKYSGVRVSSLQTLSFRYAHYKRSNLINQETWEERVGLYHHEGKSDGPQICVGEYIES